MPFCCVFVVQLFLSQKVAKEASDIVILDDNIASILSSCKYGRTIYKSIQKFITFQSTVNLASGILTLVGPFLQLDFALTLVQLLWVNLGRNQTLFFVLLFPYLIL